MNGSRSRSAGPALSALLALVLVVGSAGIASAAGATRHRGKARVSAHSTSVCPTGRVVVALPAGAAARWQRFKDAGPARIAESGGIFRGGDELARVDAFSNPTRLSAGAWLRGPQAFLRGNGARVRRGKRRHRAESGVLIEVPANPQVGARCIALVAGPKVLVRLTTEACTGARKALHKRLVDAMKLPRKVARRPNPRARSGK